jgi:hypothetical protein
LRIAYFRIFSPKICLFFALEKDQDLRLIIERWPKIPVAVRKAIVKMVR